MLCYAHPRAPGVSFTPLPCCPCHHSCTSVCPRPRHPTLFIFPSSKLSLLPQMVYCYSVFLPVPIRPRPHRRPSVRPLPRRPPPVVDCCIYFRIFISISSPFQTVFQFWAAVPQWKRGRRCRQYVRTKDKDKGHGQDDRRRAWTMNDRGRCERIHAHRQYGYWHIWQQIEVITVSI